MIGVNRREELRDKDAVQMLTNKKYKGLQENELVWVVPSHFDNRGDCVFGQDTRFGLNIPEKYLSVITKEENPEYFL